MYCSRKLLTFWNFRAKIMISYKFYVGIGTGYNIGYITKRGVAVAIQYKTWDSCNFEISTLQSVF